MLEKPNVSDEQIISHLQEHFELHVTELTFLPLGADLGTAVYRVVTTDGTAYFLKLRKGFDAVTVTVPLFLRAQGIETILVPFGTQSKQYWADFGEYKMILYPFIEGQDGFDRELTDHHKRGLGATLKSIHSTSIPRELKERLPQEKFSPQWRERLTSLQTLVDNRAFTDPPAAQLAAFMRSTRDETARLIARTEELASMLKSRHLELVLCHTDIHGGNILIGDNDSFYIVDWDNPLLAPKERDLMFIGGGVDTIWISQRDEAIFYEGYGKTEIDLAALAYFRYARVIEDLAVIAEQLLLTDEGGADRERYVGWYTGNFEPGSTIEIAQNTDKLLKANH